ncbi:hypothetical protein G9C85_12770 [Halorubellus sp. JP-L1]|uniref:hypothetical protein n=1 Tax=Halorubellus sp. JP-L1 TaxID=2715753 RepID=UPI001409FD7C|nr:hypothetical protein [Halorubellus sp. JP-L1]NHN42492.1 hypothetical protein [Halorubellus sp. JP-L1]
MRRRRLLSALSVAAVGLAGCTTGPGKSGPKWGPPATAPETPTRDESTLEPTATTTAPGRGLQASFTYATNADTDAFAVTVTVTNAIDEPRSAVLVVTWNRDGETQTEERDVSLDPGEDVSFEMTFPEVGNLSFDWREP